MISKKIFIVIFLTFLMFTTVYAQTKKIISPTLKTVDFKKDIKTLNIDNRMKLFDKVNLKPKNKGIETIFSEYWVEFLALIISIVGLLLGITGFTISNSKKKKSISKMINEIDNTFENFKVKSKRCEAELYRLHDIVDESLKKGKLDESSYHLLTNRIEKYIKEVQEK